MKKLKKLLIAMLALSVLFAVGCSSQNNETANEETNEVTAEATNETATETEATEEAAAEAIDYSAGLNENGFIDGVTAKDFVQLPDYMNISVPSDVHTIADEVVDANIDGILANFLGEEKVMDREIALGDTVNIDYVGSVDGVEFQGGSTGGAGTDVTIGVTQYIDDFLEQLIGHKPGESFDIEVTFPEEYGNAELNGKDAVFAITVNYISVPVTPELDDAFVAENLSVEYNVTTVAELKEVIKENLKSNAVMGYVQNYLLTESTVDSVPEAVTTYQQNSVINYFKMTANTYGMPYKDFIKAYAGYDSEEAMLEASAPAIEENSQITLIIQAIAEDSGVAVDDEALKAYFVEYTGSDDYSVFEEMYGIPYLKFSVLQENILNMVNEKATLAN
ncbi:hypothetical protein EZV73_19865 [Acidaminobacter sp. JC074]|uniref:trigger factor n=1 Tax=Acidaminobacter sp. JC074 TaxID=2530199 RepID=UPI001F0DD784|nr:FKBP-type peptidyl-prolyl cis-trans isomerase [Acidaminobacter sp. JC074]MCH4889850.1 hypothetical protein [Acidaminobacter sp. JC074]